MTWTFNPTAYGPAVAELLAGDRLPDLGPVRANAALPLLQKMTPEQLFPGRTARDMNSAFASALRPMPATA